MKLNAPKRITWIISLILAALSLAFYLVPVPALAPYVYWLMGAAWLLIFLGTIIKGL